MRNTKLIPISISIICLAFLFLPVLLPVFDTLGPEKSFVVHLFISIGGFFLALYIAFWLEFINFRSSVERQISNGFKVQERGLPAALKSQLKKDVLAADTVRNTFVGIQDDGISDIYETWLQNESNGTWQDIVGIPEFFSERFRAISISGTQHARHKIFVLREFSHIINFVILTFPGEDRPDIVYFGWIANDEDSVTRLFSSSAASVVSMFENQFRNLKRITWNYKGDLLPDYGGGFNVDHSWPVTKKQHIGPPSLIDKSGIWETISFHFDEDGNRVAGSLATVKIEFNVDRVDVTSQLYNLFGEQVGDFASESEATYSLNNLFFVYKLRIGDITGLCHYKFFRHHSGIKMLCGVFCDSMLRSRNTVVGFHLSDIHTTMPKYSNSEAIARIDELTRRINEMDPSGSIKDGPSLGLLWDGS